MLNDITLGQYFPGKSIIHRIDARVKIIVVFLFICSVFTAANYVGYIAMYALLALIVGLSQINLRTIIKSIKPVLFVLIFTAIVNIFMTDGQTPLVSFYFIKIYPEGLIFATLMALRIICLVIGTFVLLTYTTSPVALTDAIERLLTPLSFFKVPTHEFAMMMTIALRFIPILIEETQKIINAQKARGADFENGSLMQRAKALIPILIPLFVSAFRRADELASAMECRLYRGGEGRTRMKILKLKPEDILVLVFFAAFLALIIYLNFVFPKVI